MAKLRHAAELVYGRTARAMFEFGGEACARYGVLKERLLEQVGDRLSLAIGSDTPVVSPDSFLGPDTAEATLLEMQELARATLGRNPYDSLPTDEDLARGSFALADVGRLAAQVAAQLDPNVVAEIEAEIAAIEREAASSGDLGRRLYEAYNQRFGQKKAPAETEEPQPLHERVFRLMAQLAGASGVKVTIPSGRYQFLRLDYRGWFLARDARALQGKRLSPQEAAPLIENLLGEPLPNELQRALGNPSLLKNAYSSREMNCQLCGKRVLGYRRPSEHYTLFASPQRYAHTHDGQFGGPCGGESNNFVIDTIPVKV